MRLKEENKSFIKEFKKIILSMLIGFAVFFIIIDALSNYADYKQRSKIIREKYINSQKQKVKNEVLQVVKNIKYYINNFNKDVKFSIKASVNNTYKSIMNLYTQNKSMNKLKMLKLIKAFLKPIKLYNDNSYVFLIDLNGRAILIPPKPELEGKMILNDTNEKGRYPIKEMIEMVKEKGEGFIEYVAGKPNTDDFHKVKKLSYVKLLKEFNIIIGTGVYLDDIQKRLQKNILNMIANVRFGKEGYIFANKFDGTALVSNGKIFAHLNKKLWELFHNDIGDSVRDVFNKEIKAAQTKDGDYINYYWVKLTNIKKIAPKVSFIFGIKKWKWLIGAGVYIDDIEKDINSLFYELKTKLVKKYLLLVFIVILLLIMLSLIYLKLNKILNKDLNVFISFFNSAVYSDKYINIEKIKFIEFKEIAGYANKMVENKIDYQNKLIKEKEKLSITLKSIGDGVIVTDKDGKVEMINLEAERLTGWKNEEAIGKYFCDIFYVINESTGKRIKNPVKLVLKKNNKINISINSVLISKNGERYNVGDSAAPIKDKDNNTIGVIIVFRDITKQLKMEEELLKNKKIEAIAVLAGGIAHDFNNILTGIFGNIDIARRKIDKNSDAQNFLQTSLHSLQRATNLTKQLLTFAKGGEPIFELIDLREIINDVVEFILSGSNVIADIDISDDLYNIEADKGQISQVISNLIINAKQAMPDGGNIFIRVFNIEEINKINKNLSGKYIAIEVEDQGLGMKKEILDKIFDPYFTTKEQGTGLGLAVVHSIVRKHKGFIEVESKINQGTTFKIYLPGILKKNEKTHNRNNQFINHKLKGNVLVMDDEDVVRDVVKEMLIEMGFEVDTAIDGEEAIEKFIISREKKRYYDIIIMDLTIPGGIGGQEASKEILKIDKNAKIIVTSGYSNDPVMSNYKKYGFTARIVKPFYFDVLKRIITEILDQRDG